jgi:hypothetical protein
MSLISSSNSQLNGEDHSSSSKDEDDNIDVFMSASNPTDSLEKDNDESMNGTDTPSQQLVPTNPPSTDRMFDDDSEDADDSVEGTASEGEEDAFLQQSLIFPRATNDLPQWKRVQRSRFGMLNVVNAAPKVIECVPSKVNDFIDEYNIETHYNRYEALWFESPQEPSTFDYDAIIEDDHGNTVIHAIQPLPATTQELIVAATMDFQVETMSRQRLFEFVDAHLANEAQYTHGQRLASIFAQPSFHSRCLRNNGHDLSKWITYHSLFRFGMYSPCTDKSRLLLVLETSLQALCAQYTTPLQALQNRLVLPESVSQDFPLNLAWWDLYCLIMAPMVYFDPEKIFQLTNHPARYLSQGPFTLLTDVTLIRLAQSNLGTGLTSHEATPTFVKNNVSAVAQAPSNGDSDMIGHLHF